MAKIRLLPRAEEDIDEVITWYLARNPRAARTFNDAVTAATERVRSMPELYALGDDSHRRCPVGKSRYVLVYRYDTVEDEVVVAGVVNPAENTRRF